MPTEPVDLPLPTPLLVAEPPEDPQPGHQCREIACPMQFILDIIGSKWAILILRELFSGDRRTHEFLAALPGISTKTLTARLREMEHHGLIHRRVFPEVPPRVEYSLTAKGREVQPLLMTLKDLGERWLEQDPCCCPMDPVYSLED